MTAHARDERLRSFEFLEIGFGQKEVFGVIGEQHAFVPHEERRRINHKLGHNGAWIAKHILAGGRSQTTITPARFLTQGDFAGAWIPGRILILPPTAKLWEVERGSVTRSSLARCKGSGLSGNVVKIRTCCGSQSRAPVGLPRCALHPGAAS